jgi:polyhydroxyalkanoate synthase
VFEQPIFIVPAWIMKYYILDLSPHNSLVNYLVGHGHTVYMISWRNPSAEDRDCGMDDYLHQGVLTALNEIIKRESLDVKIQAVGYCLGGTLLAMAAAWLAQQKNKNIASLTLLAAQTDFTEAGELRLFIDESQLDYLDDMMWNQGYLDTRQMAGTFQLLRSNDLIWSRMVNLYLLGKREVMTDLMAWNADATRMPFRMQSEYLRQLFLNNDLFQGRLKVNNQTIALSDIELPTFVVATETDHVAPWRSVYKINLAISGDVTFLLTSGGHNAGITSEPGHPRRHYKIGLCPHADRYTDPEAWLQVAHYVEGSWWPAWTAWLERAQSQHAATQIAEPVMQGLPAAPGDYVLQK